MGAGGNETLCGIPHPHLGDRVNRNIVQSAIEGGVYLKDLPASTTLRVETENRTYTLVTCGGGDVLISGHPHFCPAPVRVRVCGSNWGGSMLKTMYLGRGMHFEFRHPAFTQPIVTSRIVEIRQVSSHA